MTLLPQIPLPGPDVQAPFLTNSESELIGNGAWIFGPGEGSRVGGMVSAGESQAQLMT
jgi:hypothetical protein